jgi:uncharacterized YccA/Bax inhibitor family protein
MIVRRLLAVLLLVVEPVTLALRASGAIASLIERGPASIAFLVICLAIAGLGMAAGRRLWQRRAGGIVLARWTLAFSLAAVVVSHTTRLWPDTLPPGLAGPVLTATLAWYGAWLAWTLSQHD